MIELAAIGMRFGPLGGDACEMLARGKGAGAPEAAFGNLIEGGRDFKKTIGGKSRNRLNFRHRAPVQDYNCEDNLDRTVISFDGDGLEAIITATEATEQSDELGRLKSNRISAG